MRPSLYLCLFVLSGLGTLRGMAAQPPVHAPDHAGDATDPAVSAGVELRWQREPSMGCTPSNVLVTVISPEIARTIGLEFTQVQAGKVERTVQRNAGLAYNANRYARLSSRTPGVVAEVLKDLGEKVKKGDVLVVVDSSDFGTAKTDLLLALETAKLWEGNAAREQALVEKGAGIEREAIEAQTRAAEGRITVSRARLRLRNLGLSKENIEAVERDGDTSSLLQLTAPFDGAVVERAAVMGEMVEATKPLVAIADTGTMWAMVDLTESDLSIVQPGQPASVTLDGLPGKPFAGKVTWISTQVDEKTRTIKARIELDNGMGLLRANMFGRALISTGGSTSAVTIPKDAVQWEGCCNIAFVRTDAEGRTFRPARLTLAFDAGDRYEVADGLKAGETVVTTGSFILKNEILKDLVGAGCCEVEHLTK